MEIEKNPERGMSYLQQFSCGVGHVINDVTRRLLQSFRMIFLMRVVGISATYAGLFTLYGFFAGALLFAPMAGFLCDKVKIPVLSRRLGKKKSWHLFGTIAATIGVPLLFSQCLVCGSGTSEWVVLLYYFSIATVISFSINFVDISHLSIILVLAKDQSEAAKLTALRTGFMYLTGIVSYLVAWLILGQDSRDQLTKESSMDFMVITLIMTGVGLICSAIFYFGTNEPSDYSGKNRRSRRKTSFIQSPVDLHSMVYFDRYQQRKENVRDRVIHSRRLFEEQTGPVRERSFFQNFFEAIFAGSETREAAENKTLDKEIHDPAPNMAVVPMAVTSEDDLAFVKTLPKERKLSLMMSIFDKLITKQEDSTKENDAKPSNGRLVNDISKEDGQGVMENGQQKSEVYNQGHKLNSGLDNQGFDTKETQLNQHSQDVSQDEGKAVPSVASDIESAQPPKRKAVRTWLKDPHLYKVAIIYACTKGSQDVFYAYLPLLLTDKLQFEKEAIANLPLILLVSATLSTQISRKLSGKVGKKWSFIVAALTVTGSCMWFLRINQSSRVFTYPAVVLLGLGSSAMLVNALGFATELIGDNKGSSGFVISVVGTISSLTSGTLYIVIQVLFPEGSASADCEECRSYVQNVFSLVPSSLATFSLLIVIIFQVNETIRGKKGTEKETVTDSGFSTHL
ncbi:major facilitator superfamily domain-containing protein 12-like [Pocillopora verrucosa]|uniref:major facilitator superfamily domain-containing protein 12-like n=1 Tax=Pocillopora verrucosa TaxID=203993 RepID=UPI00333E8DD6